MNIPVYMTKQTTKKILHTHLRENSNKNKLNTSKRSFLNFTFRIGMFKIYYAIFKQPFSSSPPVMEWKMAFSFRGRRKRSGRSALCFPLTVGRPCNYDLACLVMASDEVIKCLRIRREGKDSRKRGRVTNFPIKSSPGNFREKLFQQQPSVRDTS